MQTMARLGRPLERNSGLRDHNAPRQFADRDVGGAPRGHGIDDRERVRAAVRDVKVAAIRCQRHFRRCAARDIAAYLYVK
jgi:hypothetical protein